MKYQFPLKVKINAFIPLSWYSSRAHQLKRRQDCCQQLNSFLIENKFEITDKLFSQYEIVTNEQLFLLMEKFDVRILNVANEIDILVDLKGFNFSNY